MKVLAIRTAPKQFRYALLKIENGEPALLNGDGENLVKIPSGIDEVSVKLSWIKQEIDRILRQNKDIDHIVIKTNEYGRGGESISSRTAAYLDAIVFLAGAEAGISVSSKVYSQLGTKRAEVMGHAEIRVGRTSAHWNEQMADAIMAAWSAKGNA